MNTAQTLPHTRTASVLQKTGLAFVALCMVTLTGCRLEMYDDGKMRPYEPSTFYADSSSTRTFVEGTVARGHLRADDHLYKGVASSEELASRTVAPETGAQFTNVMPFEVTEQVLLRGENRYNVYCSPCHGQTGYGDGIIVQRGMKVPPSYHIDRMRTAPTGYFYDVMTNGFGVMYSYASRIKPEDRWAIAAYIRALQLSQNATLENVPADKRGELEVNN